MTTYPIQNQPAVWPALSRRRVLSSACVVGAVSLSPLSRAQAPLRGDLALTLIADTSAQQIDVTKDFLVGARLAVMEANAGAKGRSRPVVLRTLDTDGSAKQVEAAWRATLASDAAALVGTVGDGLATRIAWMNAQRDAMPHLAPWLLNSSAAASPNTWPAFASREQQIAHTMLTLQGMGMTQVGIVYATDRERGLYEAEFQRLMPTVQMHSKAWTGSGDTRSLGAQMRADAPAVLVFVGGTPELAGFCQGLAKQSRQRFVVGLADVDLATVHQMGTGGTASVIATQVVPGSRSSIAVVRAYRLALSRFFDEAPTPMSLAGYISMRGALAVLPPSGDARAAGLSAIKHAGLQTLDGFPLPKLGVPHSGFVTQSMLSADGRLVS
jgi:hypothetical protein